jgi:hypothetical protein
MATTNIDTLAINNMVRRLKISANAPAGKANKNIGSVVTVCTKDITSGYADKSTINHAAPTECIHVPILETNAASHITAKVLYLKALNADCLIILI